MVITPGLVQTLKLRLFVRTDYSQLRIYPSDTSDTSETPLAFEFGGSSESNHYTFFRGTWAAENQVTTSDRRMKIDIRPLYRQLMRDVSTPRTFGAPGAELTGLSFRLSDGVLPSRLRFQKLLRFPNNITDEPPLPAKTKKAAHPRFRSGARQAP